MLCDCSLQILNNFIFEFVFYKWRPSGQWSTCWGLGAWLPWTPATPRWVLCYMLSTPWSPGPSLSLQPLLPSTWASTRWGHFLDLNIRKVRVGHLVTPAGASTACSVGSWLWGGVALTHPWSSNNCAPAWRWQSAIWVTHLPWVGAVDP